MWIYWSLFSCTACAWTQKFTLCKKRIPWPNLLKFYRYQDWKQPWGKHMLKDSLLSVTLIFNELKLSWLSFLTYLKNRPTHWPQAAPRVTYGLIRLFMRCYFPGKHTDLFGLSLILQSCSPLQERLWACQVEQTGGGLPALPTCAETLQLWQPKWVVW